MIRGKFVVRLKALHDATGKTFYRVAKESGVTINTVARFGKKDAVTVSTLSAEVVRLIRYYGADWRDSGVVQYVVENEEEQKALLATA